jgi:hypothetical protein
VLEPISKSTNQVILREPFDSRLMILGGRSGRPKPARRSLKDGGGDLNDLWIRRRVVQILRFAQNDEYFFVGTRMTFALRKKECDSE